MKKPPHTRLHLSLPPDWLELLRKEAQEAKQTPSEYIRTAIFQRFPKEERYNLTRPTPRGRQPQGAPTP